MITNYFLKKAKQQRRKIGIVIAKPIPETIKSLKKASQYASLIVITPTKIKGLDCIVEKKIDKASRILVTLLKKGEVNGIVRGQAKDSTTLKLFFKIFNKKEIPANRKVYGTLLKKGNKIIALGTASIYQGLNLADKKYEADQIIKYLTNLNIKPKIAVMSARRNTSIKNKFLMIERLHQQAEKLVKYLNQKGYQAKNYAFEYETAINDGCNLILCPLGIVGNAFLRALIYLGGWQIIASCYLGLGVVYEDGSRNETDFFWHIVHAAARCNMENL